MENIVYISNIDKQETKIKGYSKLLFEIYDKKGETDVFSTSTMSDYSLERYINEANKVLETNSFFKNKFGVNLKAFKTIQDDKNNIVGLARQNGILLKNEVKQMELDSDNEIAL